MSTELQILSGKASGARAGAPCPGADERTPRILITRLSHIGDCILAMPILNALRAHWPHARIDWVVEKPAAPLLEHHAALDELIVLPRGWLKSPSLVWRLRSELRRRRYEVAIDPQSLTKSSVLGWLAGAKTRIGFAGADGRELSRWLNNRRILRTETHMVSRGLELLRPLGIVSPAVEFRVPVGQPAREMAAECVQREGIEEFAALNPGAGWDSRLWPMERYGLVAQHLGQRHGLASLVVWAGPRERRWAEQIVSESQGRARLAPPTTLLELAAILERARLFVGSDTGPLHLAVAVGTRCVSLHGPTLAAQSGPYGPGHRALQAVYLEGTSRQRRRADNESMQAIEVASVCQACDEVLAESASREPAPKEAKP